MVGSLKLKLGPLLARGGGSIEMRSAHGQCQHVASGGLCVCVGVNGYGRSLCVCVCVHVERLSGCRG